MKKHYQDILAAVRPKDTPGAVLKRLNAAADVYVQEVLDEAGEAFADYLAGKQIALEDLPGILALRRRPTGSRPILMGLARNAMFLPIMMDENEAADSFRESLVGQYRYRLHALCGSPERFVPLWPAIAAYLNASGYSYPTEFSADAHLDAGWQGVSGMTPRAFREMVEKKEAPWYLFHTDVGRNGTIEEAARLIGLRRQYLDPALARYKIKPVWDDNPWSQLFP
jgi:hypothetical protein